MTESDKSFYKGFGLALSTLLRDGQYLAAYKIIREHKIYLGDLKACGLIEFDINPIVDFYSKNENMSLPLKNPSCSDHI